jgi:hypothetical protein
VPADVPVLAQLLAVFSIYYCAIEVFFVLSDFEVTLFPGNLLNNIIFSASTINYDPFARNRNAILLFKFSLNLDNFFSWLFHSFGCFFAIFLVVVVIFFTFF